MQVSLATRFTATIAGVVTLAATSSLLALTLAYLIGNDLEQLVEENLASVIAAEELEIALLDQRGFASAYILDEGNALWLEGWAARKKAFAHWLTIARQTAVTPRERSILDELDAVVQQYDAKRDEAVAAFDRGEMDRARRVVLEDVRELADRAYGLCEEYIAVNRALVHERRERSHNQFVLFTWLVLGCVAVTLVAGGGLVAYFLRSVLLPLRRMAAEAQTAAQDATPHGPGDEMRALGFYLKSLMTDVAETRSHLERSHQRLESAEKLAAVGKLAASVAHEIRNPLTAIKMWLYSIRQAVGHNAELEHKLDIVSEEIARLERIVRDFLQFSRPPELQPAQHTVEELLARPVELLAHRLEAHGIRIKIDTAPGLPAVWVDGEQISQVLLNLLNNAIEAMPQGGEIRLRAVAARRAGSDCVVVHVEDTGGGMPDEAQERIFEPFFTTRPEGTGLGLCVAARIMQRHGGHVVLESSSLRGTTFAVWIPLDFRQSSASEGP
jgi:signal transduction histidine kinase